MLDCVVGRAESPPAYHHHRCLFCQASLIPGERYIQHMRHHLAHYNTLQPASQPLITAAASPPPQTAAVDDERLVPAADRAVRVKRFRKRRMKPAAVKVVKKEVGEEEDEVSSYGGSRPVSDDDCLGDSELSDSDSDTCHQQTEKVINKLNLKFFIQYYNIWRPWLIYST